MATEPTRYWSSVKRRWVYSMDPPEVAFERPWKEDFARPVDIDMPREQGARAGQYVVPYKADPRSARPKPLPWGPGGAQVIPNEPTSDWRRWETETEWGRELRRAKRVVQRLNEINKYMNAFDTIEGFTNYVVRQWPSFKIKGWTKCDGDYPPTANHNDWDGIHVQGGALDCAKRQLLGQGYSGHFLPLGDLSPGSTIDVDLTGVNQVFMNWGRPSGFGAEHSSWVRNPTNTAPLASIEVYRQAFGSDPMQNPNLTRLLAPDPQPLGYPTYRTNDVTFYETWTDSASQELEGSARAYARSVPVAHAFSIGGGRLAGPPTSVRAGNRAPPEGPGRNKERKARSRAAIIGIALYKALDFASEIADIVDAVYEALPEDVKKRWSRPKRQGDSFGQYGANGADWKLQALWHNWHRLDAEQAVKNIVKNELQDFYYGFIHRHIPRGAGGPAMEDSWKKFDKILDRLFQQTGLF